MMVSSNGITRACADSSHLLKGYGEDRGIIPLTCEALFERITSSTSSTLSYTVEVSFMEIYKSALQSLHWDCSHR